MNLRNLCTFDAFEVWEPAKLLLSKKFTILDIELLWSVSHTLRNVCTPLSLWLLYLTQVPSPNFATNLFSKFHSTVPFQSHLYPQTYSKGNYSLVNIFWGKFSSAGIVLYHTASWNSLLVGLRGFTQKKTSSEKVPEEGKVLQQRHHYLGTLKKWAIPRSNLELLNQNVQFNKFLDDSNA